MAYFDHLNVFVLAIKHGERSKDKNVAEIRGIISTVHCIECVLFSDVLSGASRPSSR